MSFFFPTDYICVSLKRLAVWWRNVIFTLFASWTPNPCFPTLRSFHLISTSQPLTHSSEMQQGWQHFWCISHSSSIGTALRYPYLWLMWVLQLSDRPAAACPWQDTIAVAAAGGLQSICPVSIRMSAPVSADDWWPRQCPIATAAAAAYYTEGQRRGHIWG